MVWQNPLGGVENSFNGGLYHFREKFNPTIAKPYLGEFTMPHFILSILLLRLALDFRKTLRKKKHRK